MKGIVLYFVNTQTKSYLEKEDFMYEKVPFVKTTNLDEFVKETVLYIT